MPYVALRTALTGKTVSPLQLDVHRKLPRSQVVTEQVTA